MYNKTGMSKEEKIAQRAIIILFCVFAVFSLFILTCKFVIDANYSYFLVTGCSMSPAVNSDVYIGMKDENGKEIDTTKTGQDSVLCRKNVKPKHGDIVALALPDASGENKEKYLLKRVIAMEGDLVTICKVSNGSLPVYRVLIVYAGTSEVQVLEEEYLNYSESTLSDSNPYIDQTAFDVYKDWTYSGFEQHRPVVPDVLAGVAYEKGFYSLYLDVENNYFMQGSYATSERVEVVDGIRFFKLNKDEIFFLGDNRKYSSDSRSGDKGIATTKNVKGVVEMVVSGDLNNPILAKSLWRKLVAYSKMTSSKISQYFAWNA